MLKVCIFALVGVPLARQHKRQLLQSDWISALLHELTNQLDVVHLLRDTHSLGIPLKLPVNVERSPEGLLHFFCVRRVVRAGQQVVADTLEVVRAREVCQCRQSLNLQQKVDGFRLFIMVDELRDDLVDKLVYFVHTNSRLHSLDELLSDLASQASEILVTPANKFSAGSLQAKEECFSLFLLLRSHHCDNAGDISTSSLN